MPDISAISSDAGSASSVVSGVDADFEASFLQGLAAVTDVLRDGTDHPEMWAMLDDAASVDDVPTLLAIIDGIRPFQTTLGAHKLVDLVAAMLTGFGGDVPGGLAILERLEILHPHCPQVAGAHFHLSRAHDPDRSSDLSTRFCDAPFVKFETLIDGTVSPCCSIWTKKRLGRLDNHSADEIWNSESAQEMRESILDGSYRYCNKKRCTLIMEDSLPLKSEVVAPVLRAVIDAGTVVMEQGPKWLFLAHDLTCNLACPSCRTGIMAADAVQEARFEKIEAQVLRPLLNADGEVEISVSGQGDPWSSPHYRSILRYLADHELTVKLNLHTNALLMGEARWNQYLGLEKYRPLVDVSIDSCTPWIYDVVRKPGKWAKLLPNLMFIGEKRKAGIFSEYHLNATIQIDNFHEMPALIDFSEKMGADSMRLYMIQNTGGHISPMFRAKNVADSTHILHLAFLETLRDDRLGRPHAHLYDVATWRKRSFETILPSDGLVPDVDKDGLFHAVEGALQAGTLHVAAALCAAGRRLFPCDVDVIQIEGCILSAMGLDELAGYRVQEVAALSAAFVADRVPVAA